MKSSTQSGTGNQYPYRKSDDTKSEDTGSESESSDPKKISLASESQASSSQSKNKEFNPFESQIEEIDSMLADF
ncbi:hypothetical protein RCL_jg3587.t1 [Rhizophagus clarus]|uniref:Uncharacterized protein n=1 Tax=Rhizophagus clarus TaxID=94130 RepID=A0A8H3R2H1_9GLOM|nr:hypothetical protein RCL_jg3587.t1 [Rhizophagus clarus]